MVEAVEQKPLKKGHGVQCPRCGSEYMKRTRREGFVQEKLYSIFGYYPWRCTKCLGNFMMKKRGMHRRHQEIEPAGE
jgi:DNA-directed RNA polymerase subunit RPC12/RpoP